MKKVVKRGIVINCLHGDCGNFFQKVVALSRLCLFAAVQLFGSSALSILRSAIENCSGGGSLGHNYLFCDEIVFPQMKNSA